VILFRFLIYGVLGWCMEILWTAVKKRITGEAKDWLLTGDTSLWSFFLYGTIVFLYEPIHNLLRSQPAVLRGVGYLAGFWLVEYLGGRLIWIITRRKPWDYSNSPGGSLHGLIRWYFAIIWPFVGLALEPLHDFLVRIGPLVLKS
jgi:uncharacterized membrane protein